MITQQTFAAVLSTCGYSVAMFGDAGGISKREAQAGVPTWHREELGKLLAAELSAKLETETAPEFRSALHARLDRPGAGFSKAGCGRRSG